MRRLPLRSPPRMRGKGNLLLDGYIPLGITPAYAGKRDLVISGSGDIEDHPRVCGEKIQPAVRRSCAKGSPPRMRGKGIVHVLVPEEFGITPACAGKRADCPTWGCTGWDHPRVCGEKMCIQCSKSIPQGSPPRMRGKVPCRRVDQCRLPVFQVLADTVPHCIPDTAAHDGRQVLRGLRHHLKCDRDGHLRLVQVGNVVHERALMPDVHESQPRRTPQRHNDRMGQPVQAGMHGGSHGGRGRAAVPKCPPPGSERSP